MVYQDKKPHWSHIHKLHFNMHC